MLMLPFPPFHTPIWKTGRIMGTPAAGGRATSTGFSLSQRVFIRSLSNLLNMLVGIISQPSSITSQIPPGTPELWPLNCPKLGFKLFKSKSFHPVFIKHGEYVGRHNISTKFYNQPNPPCTPELWPLNCPKLGFTLSKSKSFHPVFIKHGECVSGHNILTKFYNLPNPPRHSWIMALKINCHYPWIDHKYDGCILCQFGTLVYS